MRVRLLTPEVDGACRISLTPGAEYEVIGIEADWLRLINDRGEPVLYDPARFQVTDATEPPDWLSFVEDGVRYAYPPEWGHAGYFEDWHNGIAEVRAQFAEQFARRSSKPSNQE